MLKQKVDKIKECKCIGQLLMYYTKIDNKKPLISNVEKQMVLMQMIEVENKYKQLN